MATANLVTQKRRKNWINVNDSISRKYQKMLQGKKYITNRLRSFGILNVRLFDSVLAVRTSIFGS